jgi:hypothetical protein
MPITAPRTDVPRPLVRRLRDADLTQVENLCRRQTPDDLRLRFFSPAPRLTPAVIGGLTAQRDGDRVAFVATDGDQVTGLARYDRMPGTDRADAWLLVDGRDPTPRLDLRLVTELLSQARRAGVRRLALEVHPLDRHLLDDLTGAPFRSTSHLHSGMVTVTIDAGADPDEPDA